MYDDLKSRLSRLGLAVISDADMSRLSFYRTGGKAALLCCIDNAADAQKAYLETADSGAPFFVMGNCSNVLVSDSGYDGVILKYSGGKGIRAEDGGTLVCDGGVPAAKACATAMYLRLSGGEFMGTIPGTISGLTRMNAGCFGKEMSDIVSSVSGYIDKKPFTFDSSACSFGYRSSVFCKTDNCVILSVTLKLSPAPLSDILERTKQYRERRRQSQPVSERSLGSIFKRTPQHAAAYLIDRAGLKGLSVGGAQVSQKHAGFIVNTGSATAADTARLINLIKDAVYDEFDVRLQEEIIYLGKFDT